MSKILVLSNFGMGLYKFRKELLKELINQGHDVYVSLPNDAYVPLLEGLGCNFIETNLDRRGTNPISDMKLLFSYIKIIRSNKPDIVLTYTIKPNIYGGLACRMTRTPYISNITGLGTAIENQGIMQKLTLFLYKIGLKKAKTVFFQNKSNEEFFCEREIIKSPTIIIPGSGVNLKEHPFEEYPQKDDIIWFLYVGRIMKNKGIDELIEAATAFKDDDNLEFHIVGFCEEEYLTELDELDDKGIIHYHGQQNDVHKFIKYSHATVLPSYHEGLSNVLLESAATGRPVLASNVNGCKETFDEGISGFGFDVKSTESLVKAIKTFKDLPYERKKAMGSAGRKKMETEFDRNIVIQSYLKTIKQ